MKDKSPSASEEDTWRKKFNASQDELRLKEKQWQDTEKLVSLLVSRLSLIASSPDQALTNNLQVLCKAMREGKGILELNLLVRDISERILQLQGTELKSLSTSQHQDGQSYDNIQLVYEVLIVLLDNIHFPSAFSDRINRIRHKMATTDEEDRVLPLVAGITALAEVLDDIFYNVKHDKEKFGLFLQEINSDLQNLDSNIIHSGNIQVNRENAETTVNDKVKSEVNEMENIITSQLDIEQIKTSVQTSMLAIREHMEKFQQDAARNNQQSSIMMKKLRSQLSQMEGQCATLKRQIIEKHQQTMSDPLTGIRNRLAYEEAISQELERHKRYQRPLCLLMLDLDHFKHVNDTYGHHIGDKVLQDVAKILASNIRAVDFVARLGGEEFVIILPELDIAEAEKVANKICKAIQASQFMVEDRTIRITISVGIAQTHENDTPNSLFERADTAMYLAKERGRNRVETE